MTRIIKIELAKIIPYKVFWVMVGLYVLAVAFIFFGFPALIDYFTSQSASNELKLLKNFIYNFPDIWQNLGWIASLRFFVKIFLGLIVIITITNEYSFGTVRSNIINGMSRLDFLKAKIGLIFIFSLAATFLVLISGLILGLSYSSVTTLPAIIRKTGYLGGYFLEVFTYMSFAMLLGLIFRRTGFALGVLFIYPIIELIIQQKIPEKINIYLPLNAMNRVIRTPNTSMIQYSSPQSEIELQTHLGATEIMVAAGYAVLFILVSYWILKKRDL